MDNILEKIKTFAKAFMVKFKNFIVGFGSENLVFAFFLGWCCSILSPLGWVATSVFTVLFGVLGFLAVKEDSDFLDKPFFTKKVYLTALGACIISIIFSILF